MKFILAALLALAVTFVAAVPSPKANGPGGALNLLNATTAFTKPSHLKAAGSPVNVAPGKFNETLKNLRPASLQSNLLLGCSVASADSGGDLLTFLEDWETFMWGIDSSHNYLIADIVTFGPANYGVQGVDWDQIGCVFNGIFLEAYALRNAVATVSDIWGIFGFWSQVGTTFTFFSPV